MSETEPVLEPVPVTKDISVVNGNSDINLPPPEPELQNGINKSDMDMSNGVDELNMNGDNVADGEPGPVNGDLNGPDEVENEDLMGVDELPPPPEVVPELPPPPEEDSENQELLCTENEQFGSSVDPVIESSVDPDPQDVGEIECVDENEDIMNVSDSDTNPEGNIRDSIEIPKNVEDVSEEELVSDSGLQDEVEVEIQNNQQNEEVEQMNEGPLIDLGEPQQSAETPGEPKEVSAPLLDFSEPIEPETPAAPAEPKSQQEEVEDVQQDTKEPVESLPEPPQSEEPERVPVAEPVSAPVSVEVVESQPEPEVEQQPEPQPELVAVPIVQQAVEPEVPETTPVVEEQQQEPVPESMPQVGYAEPAIVVDNKPAEEAAEVPPPPPPPLVEETPTPPPPLDENIPLRRVSGSSTPNKQSPSKEIESPVAITSPVNVAVVSPQPEPVVVQQEPEKQPEPIPVPVKPEPVAQPAQTSQPVAIVAPQVVSEEGSQPASPPGSSSTGSEHAPSEEEKPEGEPVVSPQVSQKINKKNFKNKIKFGVDLVEASLKQLHFLYVVNKHPGLYEEWLFKKAIRRYEAFWLPLAAEHKKESLAAPLDIEWVWHCHMLAPLAYEADCKNIVGLVVEHKLMSEKDRTKSLEKSKKYWTAKYPNEPFEIDLVFKEKVVEEKPEEQQPKEAQDTTEAKETEAKGNLTMVTIFH